MTTPGRAFNGRRKTPRARSGCVSCRRRKLKCDESRPLCRRCHDTGAKCIYAVTLTWPEAETRRSVKRTLPSCANPGSQLAATGASGREITHRALPLCYTFLNTTWDDFGILFNGSVALVTDGLDAAQGHGACEALAFHQPLIQQSNLTLEWSDGYVYDLPLLPSSHHLRSSPSGQRLFQFYSEQMCPKCPFVDGYNNRYRQVIIPLSLQSPLLLKSVLAAAANQLKFFAPQYTTTALQYRGATLRSLTRVFTHDDQETLSRTELLGIVLMLCMYDLSNNEPCKSRSSAIRNQAWLVHLEGARRLMELSDDSPCDEAVTSMLGQYLSAYSILAYTTLVDQVEESIILRGASYWLTKIARPAEEVQCFTGCSHELLSIILDVCAKIRASRNNRPTPSIEEDLKSWKIQTEERLRSLVQRTPAELASRFQAACSPAFGSQEPTRDIRNAPARTAECFRLAALILLQYLDFDAPVDANPTVAQSVQSILKLMEEGTQLPAEGKSGRSSYLWPYFIAACHVKTDEDRSFILDRLEQMRHLGASISKTVLEPIRDIVELVWKQQDLKRHAYPGTLDGEGTAFEWESVMRALDCRLNWV